MTSYTIRNANSFELDSLFRLTLEGLGHDELAQQITSDDIHPFHQYACQYGRIIVAERAGSIVGYGSAMEHEGVRWISQLFVDQDAQSTGIGRAILEKLDPPGSISRGLCATDDFRAQSLYIRRGFIPTWPILSLLLKPDQVRLPSVSGLTPTPLDTLEALVDLDHRISKRRRSSDHQFWLDTLGGEVHGFERDDGMVGYCWIFEPRNGKLAGLSGPNPSIHIGPVGVLDCLDAISSVIAALSIVKNIYPNREISIEVPGPHPALPELLKLGARIVEVETAMVTDRGAFGDPARYIPSVGVLY